MLAGIYYGAQYGGSTTAILVNLPGESSSVVTALDGYQMARQGKAGTALATAAIGSFFAGTVATVLLAGLCPAAGRPCLEVRPGRVRLMVLGLVASVVLAHGSLLHALGMIILGLILGLIGTDVNSGTTRYTFGFPQIADGINFVVVAMGVFGLGEIIGNLENETTRTTVLKSVTGLMPTREDLKRMAAPILRGTVLGSMLGILPGGGAMLASFAAYTLEKKVSRTPGSSARAPSRGGGAGERQQCRRADLLHSDADAGHPVQSVMALMIGAMIMQGIQPGPSVMTEQPVLFWGLIVSMWIGNLFLLVLNLPLIGLWVRMISVPYHFLYPAILVFCAIGVFSLNNATFDVYLMAMFGFLGYIFRKLDCEPAPMLLGFILGPMMEEHLRRAMLISKGDPTVFLSRPISAAMLVLALVLLATVLAPTVRRKREEAFQEKG